MANLIASGICIILTAIIMMPILWMALAHDPIGAITVFYVIYFLYFFLPIGLGLALIVLGLRRDRKANPSTVQREESDA